MILAETRVNSKRVKGGATESGSFLAKDPLRSGQRAGTGDRVKLILLTRPSQETKYAVP